MPTGLLFKIMTHVMVTSVLILIPFYLAMHHYIPFWVACVPPILLGLVLEMLTFYAAGATKEINDLTDLLKEAAKALGQAKDMLKAKP